MVAALDHVPETAARFPKWVRTTFWFLVILFTLIGAWEVYKAVWTQFEWEWPIRSNNAVMPHSWDIVRRLFEPARRGGDMLLLVLLEASLFTLREAVLGFALGAIFGFSLGVLFVRSALAERALMPYVVASQTVPILAIAPMVVVWGNELGLGQVTRVALIAAYITFFPVAINSLRGLRSPEPTATELMRSYAASKNQVLWKLQVPAALPYIFTALKISATASVIGAIIGELPTGSRDGLGRALLEFSQQFGSGPEKLYGAVLVSALVGIFFVAIVAIVERRVVDATRRLPG